MDSFMSKSFLSLLICSLLLYTEVKSQSNCPFLVDFTNGVSAELITANDGVSLLGIRVLWTIKSEYLNCQFSSLMVYLLPGRHSRVATVNDSSADFYNLDCNIEYTPRVRIIYSGVAFSDSGDSLFYGGTQNTAPSKLLRVCVGPESPDSQLARLNIFWDILPCHLWNGADITSYIIQYSCISGGVAQNISNSDDRVDCGAESGGPYRCLLPSVSLSTTGVSYSFQVAAVNRYGAGPFSGPVIGMIPSQNETCSLNDEASTTAGLPTTSTPITLHPVVDEDNTFPEIVTSTTQNTFTTLHPSLENQVQSNTILSYSGWIVAGSLFVILAGVITLLAALNCILWKRLKSASLSNSDQTNTKLDVSEMDIKECSAYGHVTSTKTTSAEEQHVYESTN